MIRLLARWLIPNRDDTRSPAVRRAYGALCGGVGIALNLILFLMKYAVGVRSGSMAATADAFNSLSDAGASAVTLVGFRLSGKRDDDQHPFGHGRVEYIAGLIVAVVVILMGFELGRGSILRILSPEPPAYSASTALTLTAAVLVKLYMGLYNRNIGARIRSVAMRAAAADSLSDACATLAVLASMLIARWAGLNLDGWIGALVSLLILYSGVRALWDAVSPLLGNPPDPAFVRRVEAIAREGSQVLGVHDLRVHDYGAGHVMISLHVEVPADGDLMRLHDMVDGIERRLNAELKCEAVIHMDPVVRDDAAAERALENILSAIHARMDPRITLHDFRLTNRDGWARMSFDAIIPHDRPETDAQLEAALRTLVAELYPDCDAAITVEHPFIHV